MLAQKVQSLQQIQRSGDGMAQERLPQSCAVDAFQEVGHGNTSLLPLLPDLVQRQIGLRLQAFDWHLDPDPKRKDQPHEQCSNPVTNGPASRIGPLVTRQCAKNSLLHEQEVMRDIANRPRIRSRPKRLLLRRVAVDLGEKVVTALFESVEAFAKLGVHSGLAASLHECAADLPHQTAGDKAHGLG